MEPNLKPLIQDLDRACIRFLTVRIEFYNTKQKGEDISEIDIARRHAHEALSVCFNSVLRLTKDAAMVKASANRLEIGKWGMRRGVALIDGSKTAGQL